MKQTLERPAHCPIGAEGLRCLRFLRYAARTVCDKMTTDLIRRYIKQHAIEQATKQPELS